MILGKLKSLFSLPDTLPAFFLLPLHLHGTYFLSVMYGTSRDELTLRRHSCRAAILYSVPSESVLCTELIRPGGHFSLGTPRTLIDGTDQWTRSRTLG